ncbi:MAG: DUF4920 domain-containing protein [Flavobacteriales bacterium]|nr:DUF4920 domain-containing protein [Flavobacteriales bacterium]
MKRLSLIVTVLALIGLSISSCSQQNTEETTGFGRFGDTTITEHGAVASSELPNLLKGVDSVQVKLSGTISAVCQAKGCWMSLPISDDESITVRFKDYAFFVPKNSAEHEAIVEGWAYVDTISVPELKHLAQDAEKSQEEIDAISEEEVRYTVMASGVIIK